MNAELKARWVVALRSGKYKQCRNVLRRGDAFCCLGVFRDLQDPEGWIGSHDVDGVVCNHRLNYPSTTKDLSAEDEVQLWRLNDGLEKTFPEIADYIEANL